MKYRQEVYDAVINYVQDNFNESIDEEEVDSMDRRDVLLYYLRWEGIIGYWNVILEILDK